MAVLRLVEEGKMDLDVDVNTYEGISKECGKGGKQASWLSMLSILVISMACFFARQMLDKLFRYVPG